MASLWPLTFSSGERPRAISAFLFMIIHGFEILMKWLSWNTNVRVRPFYILYRSVAITLLTIEEFVLKYRYAQVHMLTTVLFICSRCLGPIYQLLSINTRAQMALHRSPEQRSYLKPLFREPLWCCKPNINVLCLVDFYKKIFKISLNYSI